MNAKRTLVSFLAIATLLFLVATVSASYPATGDLTTDDVVIEINGMEVTTAESGINVIAGESISVKVYFTADVDTSNVRIKAEFDTENGDSYTTSSFDVENERRYVKTLTLIVPSEFEDDKV